MACFLATRQKNMHTGHHFYSAGNSVDTATGLAEADCRVPDSDTAGEVVKTDRREELVVGLADWSPMQVERRSQVERCL